MTAADAIALYRRERRKSERRNRRARMVERAVLHHKWQQLLKRSGNPFRPDRNLLGEQLQRKCMHRSPATCACTRRRRWNANGQLIAEG